MVPPEPYSTAVGLAVLGGLMVASVLLGKAGRLAGLPVALIFLGVGMLAGSEGLGRIRFTDYHLAFRLGTIALALILFDGGLNTSWSSVRRAVGPAVVLATVGVAGTAALVALGARVLGLGWGAALLLGAVVSSTDAAAVFAALRGTRVELGRKVASTIELESGLNDPMAVLLTLGLTAILAGGVRHRAGYYLASGAIQLGVGLAGGLAIGWAGRVMLRRLRPQASGILPVLSIAVALCAFGLPTLLRGSGFLAVYVAGIVLGNTEIPYRAGLLRVHDAVAWLGQVLMFVVLGLLSTPSEVWKLGAVGLAIALWLALAARPVTVLACLWPFRYRFREMVYVGWVGLRGAVPIILAIFPVMAGVPDAHRIFHLVFLVVVVSAIVPGATLPWATRRLGVEVKGPPPPRAVVEIASTELLKGELLSFYIEPASVVVGARIADLPFPEGAAVMVIVRGAELIAPRGPTELASGDHVYVVCRPEDKPLLRLFFGRAELEEE